MDRDEFGGKRLINILVHLRKILKSIHYVVAIKVDYLTEAV